MFADSICETSWQNRARRVWVTVASFTAEVLGVGILLLLPLLYTQGLPHLQLMAALAAPSPPPPPAPPAHAAPHSSSNVASDGRVITPASIPREISNVSESVPPPPVDVSGLGVKGGTGSSNVPNAVFASVGNGIGYVAPPPSVQPPPHISHIMEGDLIYRVQPQYPPLARQARIQGSVVLHAVIDREGRITRLGVLSGHPMLVSSAMEAVRQWRYRPYYLNGEPVEVETSITVNFTLSGG